MEPARQEAPRRPWRPIRLILGLGIPAALLVAIVAVWSWDWFVPLAESRLSAALGRPVRITHLHVALGRTTHVTFTDVTVGNPEGFEAEPPFARVPRLTVAFDALAYLRDRSVILPSIEVERPNLHIAETPDGRQNYAFDLGAGPAGDSADPAAQRAGPRIGELRIQDGTARVVIPRLQADLTATLGTRHPEGRDPGVVVEAQGTYAGQPVALEFAGGALLNLRDETSPWPFDLRIQNGPVRVVVAGTLRDPLQLAGAEVRLELAGPDMALLTPWTGVPIPQTTPFQATGRLDYAEGRFRVREIAGQLGRTDLSGTVTVLPAGPGRERAEVTADLRSRRVDLDDWAGFIGSQPGNAATPGQTPQQRAAVARARVSARLMPTRPINMPRLLGTDVHLTYVGDRLEGSAPLERLDVRMDIVAGVIRLHPLRFGIGQGGIQADVTLTPAEDGSFRAQATADFTRIDVSRLLAPTGFRGQGTLGGVARIDSRGRSLAEIMGRADGEVAAVVVGGDLSALLVDLSGLQFGRALLSLLGVPERTQLRCFIAEFALQRGTLVSRTLVLDTDNLVINGEGTVNLGREQLNLRIRGESKRLSVGALPASIAITGSFKDPDIGPDLAELATRGGVAGALGALAGPLALLPTIQFGTEDSPACTGLIRSRRSAPARR